VEPQCDISLPGLDTDPHPVLARLREQAPVCWVPQLGGWLVTGYDAAVAVLAAPDTFTVDDPRFTTARVTGPSMLSRDGAEHARHRNPFNHAYKPAQLQERLAEFTAAEARRLAGAIEPEGHAELREAVAGPLAAAVMTEALGLHGIGVTPATVLAWYRDIVTAVAELPPAAGDTGNPDGGGGAVDVASFGALAEKLRAAMAAGTAPLLAGAAGGSTGEGSTGEDGGAASAGGAGTGSGPVALTVGEVVSNAAVMLFGGIETTEGMICNVLAHVLSEHGPAGPGRSHRGGSRVGDGNDGAFGDIGVEAVDESLRLEPAAAVVDRYATRDVTLGGAGIRRGDLVTVSLAGANRDPALFPDPDSFNPSRPNAHRHLSFARGPHFCIGAHLARLETLTAVNTLLARLPGLRLDGTPRVRGLVFRKPRELQAAWGLPSA
jgi:cytochrome P450